MENEDYKPDNISNDTVDTYITESYSSSDANKFNVYSQNYKATSNNLKYEIDLVTKLRLALNRVDIISSDDIGQLISYSKDIDQLIQVLSDIHHTIKVLEEFDKVFNLQKVNDGSRVNIQVLTRIRRRKKKLRRKYKRRFKI